MEMKKMFKIKMKGIWHLAQGELPVRHQRQPRAALPDLRQDALELQISDPRLASEESRKRRKANLGQDLGQGRGGSKVELREALLFEGVPVDLAQVPRLHHRRVHRFDLETKTYQAWLEGLKKGPTALVRVL